MVEKFIQWFFSEVDMYGAAMTSGIVGDYIANKILGTPIKIIDLYVYSDSELYKALCLYNISL